MEPLATNLRVLMAKTRRTAKEVADGSGVSLATIYDIRAGTANPTLLLVGKIADYFGCSTGEMLAPVSEPEQADSGHGSVSPEPKHTAAHTRDQSKAKPRANAA